jgi:outer membrane protein OmpU
MKRIIISALLATIATNSFALEAPKVKLGGEIGTQVIYRDQKGAYNSIQDPKKTETKGQKLHSSAIVNDTRVLVNVDGNANGLKYGAVIKLYADTSASSSGNTNNADETYGYLESKFGRLEGASTKSASHRMSISGASIARATGGIDGDASVTFNQHVINKTGTNIENDEAFVLSPGLPTFCKCKSRANKLVYYSPKYNGLQIGLGYIIDPGMRGTVSQTHSVTKTTGSGFKNVIDASVRYDGKFNDVNYGVSLSGETSKAKNGSGEPAREGIKAWVLGGMAEYKGFSVAASYSDWMNTGRPKDKLPNAKFGSSHWTAGVAYEYQKFGVSATYMETKNANAFIGKAVNKADQDKSKNKYEIISFGADYKVAEGLLTYAEVSPFKFKREKSSVNNKGTLFMFGSKLKF